jgi:SLBB domain
MNRPICRLSASLRYAGLPLVLLPLLAAGCATKRPAPPAVAAKVQPIWTPPSRPNHAVLEITPVPSELADAQRKSPFESSLPVVGAAGEGLVRIAVTGAVNSPGIYHLKTGVSLADAVHAAGGFSRLATSRLSIIREKSLIRIVVGGGGGHEFAPNTTDYLSLFALREGDAVFVAETNPF